MQTLLRGLLVSALLVLTARAEDLVIFPVMFSKIEINGRTARMFLDTALPATGFIDPLDKHLRLKGQGTWANTRGGAFRMSELTELREAGQTFKVPLIIARLPWWARLAIHLVNIPVDGVVGWPEIRDNILVFDSAHHTIRRVDELPPETAGWLKLKVAPDDGLLLELPLADGGMGTISVDTFESGAAVRMSPARWKEWKAAHPHASRAGEIKLGALTLTDVTVKEMPSDEANDLLDEIPTATAVWTLGMPALTRLDLVVDGKNGWAYLHPKPPANTTNAQAPVKDWKVADNVHVSSDNLFVYAGVYKWYLDDFTGAEAEFDHALALNPRNAEAYSDRAGVREVLGDFSSAVSNYDKVIELRPANSEWERLSRQTLLWRLDRPEEKAKPASVEKTPEPVVVLDPVEVQGVRPRGQERWRKTLGLFLHGQLDERELLAAAKQSNGATTVPDQKAQAYYYIGAMRLSKGDKAGAREWFKKCRAAGMKDDNEYYFAVAELSRLAAVPPR